MMADDEIVTDLNVVDAPVEQVAAEPTLTPSEGPVDPAWLDPTQLLADANGSCSAAARELVSLSPPKLDAPDRARVYFSLDCGGLCGTGEVLTLNRTSGTWRVASREQLWVS